MLDQVEANRELARIIEEGLGAEKVFSTMMTFYRDHAEEPAVSIFVSMKAAKDIPGTREQSELTRKLKTALADQGDPRFPYLYFSSLDNFSGPEDVDEVEPMPESSSQP